jgi:hypothetical protein
MHDDDQQRRCEILAQARAFLERVKDLAERRDDTLPLPSPPDRVAEWRAAADLRAAELAAKPILETLERRLEQERQLTLDAIDLALGQALAEVRKNNADYLNTEVAALWRALAQAQKAIGELHQDRIKDLLRSETAIDAKAIN